MCLCPVHLGEYPLKRDVQIPHNWADHLLDVPYVDGSGDLVTWSVVTMTTMLSCDDRLINGGIRGKLPEGIINNNTDVSKEDDVDNIRWALCIVVTFSSMVTGWDELDDSKAFTQGLPATIPG